MKHKVGVLSIQGSFKEHIHILKKLGAEVVPVKNAGQLEFISGIIIPGGESTTISKIMANHNLVNSLKEKIQKGMTVYGTCAGLILLSKEICGINQPTLGLLDICVERNAFGRQLDSFEENIHLSFLPEGESFRAIFIRAPLIKNTGRDVNIIATLDDGSIVAVKKDNILVTAFHPELTEDTRVHEYFLRMVKRAS